MNRQLLQIHPEVAEALDNNRPVVALESTIIAHGMPYPQNIETAMAVENTVREGGAIPATMAIIAGTPVIGLSPDQLETLGSPLSSVMKCSRRDLPFALAMKRTGATTVSATMILAHMAGIRTFATGGIGGVHRGATETLDISADLQELATTDVAVVSAGAKAILDIGLTLEYLETHGVPVIGFGTDVFPAFYTRDSGFSLAHRLDTPEEIAAVMAAKWCAGLRGGLLIANPIPIEAEMESARIQSAIEQAIDEAAQRGITGKDVTPFLLARIAELTDGESLQSNIQLVLHNARLAAQISQGFVNLWSVD